MLQGCVCSWDGEVSALGVLLPEGGCLLGGVCSGEVSARRGSAPGGGCGIPACTEADITFAKHKTLQLRCRR